MCLSFEFFRLKFFSECPKRPWLSEILPSASSYQRTRFSNGAYPYSCFQKAVEWQSERLSVLWKTIMSFPHCHPLVSQQRERMGQGVEKEIRSSISHLHQRIICPSYQTIRQSGLWKGHTTLQSLMNTKLSPHRFWPCHESGLIKTIQTIPHNLYVSFKSASLYCGLG